MKKAFTSLISALVISSGVCFAATKVPTVKLYEKPGSSKIVATVPVNADLVSILSKEHWIKVGDRSDGNVGWINRKELTKAREAFYQPNIQTVYIHTSESDNGKPTISIIAYKNGKKLSDKEAKSFYKKMLKQQRKEQRSQQKYWHHFNDMMLRQQRDMNDMFRSDFFDDDRRPVILMPGPAITPKRDEKKSEAKTKEQADSTHTKKTSLKSIQRKRYSV